MPEENASSLDKISALRAEMQERGIDGYIIPLADEFQGEFLPPCAQRLKFLTGFTGSGGVAAVLAEKAAAFTDGRYMIQIAGQVDTDLYEIIDHTQNPIGEWLEENAKDQVIGFDPKLLTPDQIKRFEDKAPNVAFKQVEGNLIDAIWEDQPAPPQEKSFPFPHDTAGHSAEEKRKIIQKALDEARADTALITMPDSVCWLLNVRGGDVAQTPLVRSYALAHADGRIDWFVSSEKVTDELRSHIGNRTSVYAPEEISGQLKTLNGKTVLIDERHAPVWFKTQLEEAGATLINQRDPCIWPKACKTPAEVEAIKEAHIKDGVALAKCLHWLEQEAPKGQLTELDVVQKLHTCRAEDPAFKGDSFPTIAGFGANGAIIHYRATQKSNAAITAPGLLLLDSGGQYHYGTTDITRSIAIGEVSAEIKRHNTLVLKGHIDLAIARFAPGTTGKELDKLARQPLQDEGLDFSHGTGHGVGCYLGVHEEAANISPRGEEGMLPGMLVSNEPGYYEEGSHGIRIENLILCVEQGGQLGFETISLAPIDRSLVIADMLSDEQRQWLNDYHARLCETLSPHLDDERAQWLKEQTLEI